MSDLYIPHSGAVYQRIAEKRPDLYRQFEEDSAQAGYWDRAATWEGWLDQHVPEHTPSGSNLLFHETQLQMKREYYRDHPPAENGTRQDYLRRGWGPTLFEAIDEMSGPWHSTAVGMGLGDVWNALPDLDPREVMQRARELDAQERARRSQY